ncbi:MAG: MaoC/PaaZ C-terminal domain-containing protein [Hyphomonadaceae bacterium]
MPVNADALFNWPFQAVTERYDAQRTILYALGVGAGADDLPLVYEKALKALPTMAVVLAGEGNWMTDPRTSITFTHVLHGEQKLEIHKPLAGRGAVTATTSIEGLYDKGAKGAVLITKRDMRDAETGEAIATIRSSAFLRADGGFGGQSEGQPAPHPVPDRAPDLSVELPTAIGQALIYRLSGDYNPLHIDPDVARSAGFERPILHGLCSYGVAGRTIIQACCGGDPDRLRRLDVRFSTPVYPGETLVTEIWREAAGRAAFRVKVKERDVVALNNGRADYLG